VGAAWSPNTSFQYSNFGYCLLGEALAYRAGTTYPDLLKQEIAGPLRLPDTVVVLSPEQRSRLIQGYDRHNQPTVARDIDPVPGSGGIRSTAADLLTYLAAQLHPERIADGQRSSMDYESRWRGFTASIAGSTFTEAAPKAIPVGHSSIPRTTTPRSFWSIIMRALPAWRNC
jgi:CubicO group peptidase (beta-lactamase class C family)